MIHFRDVFLCALPLLCALGARAQTARPNIIVIMSDDMGFSDPGCYGGEMRTPTLDRLAAGGLRFTQFYNTARCCPTRASLLTGLYPHQAGVGHMTDDKKLEGYRGELNGSCITIAEALGGAGYRTYMTGKWHVALDTRPDGDKHDWPLQRGFEKYYGTIRGGGSYYDPTSLCRQNTYVTPDADPEYKPERFYYTDAIADHAVRFVREHGKESPDKPFFLYVAFTSPHWPLHAPDEDVARYQGAYDGGYAPVRERRLARARELGLIDPAWPLAPQAEDWAAVKHKAWESRCMEVFAAQIDRMDRGIGRLVAALEETGRLENTLILYLQDNGACAEDMGRKPEPKWNLEGVEPMKPGELQPSVWPPMRTRDGRPVRGGPGVMPGPADTYMAYGRGWANVSNTPFREYKHWVHEGGISTPLIAHWPKGIARKGELEKQPGHLIDLMATCIAAAGADYPKTYQGRAITPMEGVSLLPAFAGKPLDRKDAIYWEHEGNRAVRDGKWKIVAKEPDGPWELYDMEKDRTELTDLAAKKPGKVKELSAKWDAWARRAKAVPWPWKPAYRGGDNTK